MRLDIEVPDYTTLSRRLCGTNRRISIKTRQQEPIHVVVDSTGLKVFGEGEWKVRQHGYSKRRIWMKLHLSVNEATNEILSFVLTDNSFKDSEVFEELMDGIDADIAQTTGDGAYDAKNCWNWASQNNIRGVFPPRKDAKIKIHGNSHGQPSQRDKHIRLRRRLGKKRWKKKTKYSRRSIAETAMHRFKIIFGGHLASRSIPNQLAEAAIKCRILNRMSTPAIL